ncbi:MAG: hypothetical protein E7183_08130 [Erysipelotrichaceae bacterium]|nr:hypothetical protein [Erysipelotrichaceae bacterium]
MKSDVVFSIIFKKYKKNELIVASKLYKEEFSLVLSEATFYKIIERLKNKGKIIRVSKGIYVIPKESEFGIIPITEEDIIDDYIADEKGMVIGYGLYNKLKLTTQIPFYFEIYSSIITENCKLIQNVTIKYADLEFTKEIKAMVECLEVLENFSFIQDLNYLQFIKYTENFINNYNDIILDKVLKKIKYKKSTLSFLNNILNYYNIKNNITDYLSSFSNYKHYKMGEIHEIARGYYKV